jgi:hypothetical protein
MASGIVPVFRPGGFSDSPRVGHVDVIVTVFREGA